MRPDTTPQDASPPVIRMGTWHIAECATCQLPIPFREPEKRDAWAAEHATTGHDVTRRDELPPVLGTGPVRR